MTGEEIYQKLERAETNWDYEYHFGKINNTIKAVLLRIDSASKEKDIPLLERITRSITLDGLVAWFAFLLIGGSILYFALALFSSRRSDYDTCVFKAIEKLDSSSDILSLCKELK